MTAEGAPHVGHDGGPGDGGAAPGPAVDMRAALIAEVDFKWLMAGHGWDIDMARLGVDPVYAAKLVDWAMRSDSPALRESAAKLLAQVAPAQSSGNT